MLICKFATRTSKVSRIRTWLDYLADLERRHADDAEAVLTLRTLRDEANGWLESTEVTHH